MHRARTPRGLLGAQTTPTAYHLQAQRAPARLAEYSGPMRIALVSLHTSPAAVPGRDDAGGMNVVVAEAAHALAGRGHEVLVVTRASTASPAGERPLDPLRSNAKLVSLRAGDPDLRKEQLPRILPEAARALETIGPVDAVHAHYWLSGVAASGLAARSAVFPALTMHTVAAQKNARLAPGDTPEPAARLDAERELAKRCRIVAGSASELAGVALAAGELPAGAVVLHPGVDTALFRPASQHHGAGEPLRIVVLGRVQPLKGQDLAIQAFAALADADPDLAARSELVIAGEPTPGAELWAASLAELAERSGVAKRVRFMPAVDRAGAARLLASATIALVPSHSETFGLVAVEAAAAGVPSVVGAHTGLLESAPAGRSAVQVPGRDPAEWARAIRGLLVDPARRAALSLSAREFALTLDWARHAERLESIYAGLRRS